MSYQTVVDSLTTVLKKISDFNDSTTNVTNSDYRILSKGVSQAIVLFPGTFNMEPATMGRDGSFFVDWEIRIELYVRYVTDEDAADKIASYRQQIISTIAEYPRLDGNDTVMFAYVKRGLRPLPVFRPDGSGPWFWQAEFSCNVREVLSIETQE